MQAPPITDPGSDFDAGPLSWVSGEIGLELARALELIAAYRADPSDRTLPRRARGHVHQAAGAIALVGLDAVVTYCDEIERQLVRLEGLGGGEAEPACALVDRGCRRLKIFLDELAGGMAPVPLKLFPEYEAMQHARGVKDPPPADLFYPDLNRHVPFAEPLRPIPDDKLAPHLLKQRRLYQHGLLRFLRGDSDGAAMMRDAVSGIERAAGRERVRAFWWTTGAFFDALVMRGIDPGFGAKQLAARIDLQIRRVAEGSAQVSDRVRREVLYHVAVSPPVVASVESVQNAYGLAALIPPPETLSADLVRLQPLLRETRELLGAAKDLWLKVTSGRSDSLPKLRDALGAVQANVVSIGNPALAKLVTTLVSRLGTEPASGGAAEPFAMEYATGMLLAESAIDHFAGLPPIFPQQVEAMIARLDAAQAGQSVPDATAPLLDEMFRRAQDRVLMVQVGREIQANLRRMEQVLDAFFRDHSKRAELVTLAKESRQVRGALSILGQDDAERLLGLCQEQIDEYAQSDGPVGDEDLELLAESLSALGFFVEALEQQRPDRQRLIAPFLAKRLGEAPAREVEGKGETVEDAVVALRNELPALLAELDRAPADAAARDALRARLYELLDDAKLIDDAELVARAEAALAGFEAGETAALAAAVTAIAGSGGTALAPSPAISEETRRLLATDASGLDAELLEIYLTEAAEVLDAVAASRAELERNRDDRDALTTSRRQFHTLKGSGRMVGLTGLGDLAYDVEKIHNRLLEDERPVTPAMVALIEVAERCFRHWIAALKDAGHVEPDPTELHAAIAAVEAELPYEAKEAPAPVAAGPALFELADVGAAAESTVVVDELEGVEEIEVGEVVEGRAGAPAPAAAEDRIAEATAWADESAAPREESREAPLPTEFVIGDVTLSAELYNVLVDEAATHIGTLERELGALEHNALERPSDEMVRASHTLCGMHRSGGMPLIADIAKSLEQCLTTLQHVEGEMPELAIPTLFDAVRVLRQCVGRVRAKSPFSTIDVAQGREIQDELDALCQEASGAGRLVTEAEERTPLDAESVGTDAPEREPIFAVDGSAPPAVTTVLALDESALPFDEAPPTVDERLLPMAPQDTIHGVVSEAVVGQAPPDPIAEIRDDVDEPVLPIFLEEASELYPEAASVVRAWRRNPSDISECRRLQRTLHTFKGSARMAGAMRLGELAHLMETRLAIGDEFTAGSHDLFEALDADLDRIGFVLDALREGRVNVPLPGSAEALAAEKALAAATPGAPAAPGADRKTVVPLAASTTVARPPEGGEGEAGTRAMLRVRADIIDHLVTESGEVSITRTQIEGEMRALKANLLELTSSVIRLRAQVRDIEIQAESQIQSRLMQFGEGTEGFDPLEFDRYTRFQELARSIAEGVNDVSTVQQSLLKNLDAVDAALIAQARLSKDVQQKLSSIRTVPFASVSERLYRILRLAAKDLDKRANLEIRGAQTELDRSVLEKLVGPLDHLLRNAVDHGIEPRAVRAQAGKSETGEITLTVRQVGNEIAIEFADDGGGLNLEALRARAIAQGRLAADAQPTEDQLINLVFEPGVTTAARVTQTSGRGIGMDVVRSEIAALGGRVQVSTQAGRGTTFRLFLPLTLAVAQAVMVRAGGRLWALPAPMVEHIQHVKAEALVNLYVQRRVDWDGIVYPFHYLPRLLGDTQQIPESGRHNSVLLLRSGQSVAAIHVDEMVGNQEVVVKNIGPQLARVSGIAGATVLGNGEIVLIINPVQLAQRIGLPDYEPNAERVAPEVPRMAVAQADRPLVLIVDDSLTVRRITSRLLTREGFDVLTAKDGIEALEVLESEMPDVILLDIEMPRMDGFEFTKKIKSDPKSAQIPIVMITSRTAEKHRNRARELGVDLYLGKPFQEDELLGQLRQMLALTP